MKRPVFLAALGLGAVWSYLLCIVFLDQTVFGISWRLTHLMGIAILGLGVIIGAVYWTVRRQVISPAQLRDIGIMSFIFLLCAQAIDIGYTAYLTTLNAKARTYGNRVTDPHLQIGELLPRLYYPTDRNFQLQKPGITLTARHYGCFYAPKLMQSPTLVDSVLQLNQVTMSIDENGFRETTPLADAEIFVIGDSFAFGWGVSDDQRWTELLERRIGRSIYNFGIHDSSPKQELMILQHMLEQRPEEMDVRHVLWMVYEGNDLEGSYATLRPREDHDSGGLRNLLRGTVLMSLSKLPFAIRNQSVVQRLRSGELRFGLPSAESAQHNPYLVDGITLAQPMFASPTLGQMMFYRPYVERATKSRSYVIDHPNRPHLDQVFADMAQLSEQLDFEVTVIVVPTSVRFYASFFDDLPAVSDQPHFIDYVTDLSERMGFATVDMLRLIEPGAGDELLYFRDDDHWNQHGNAVAARIIADQVFGDEIGDLGLLEP
jgi:hypothetical protein